MEGMYWDEFRRLVERNSKFSCPLRWYKSGKGFKDTYSICDFSLPRRKGLVNTSRFHQFEERWFQESFVCNGGVLDGWVPLRNNPYLWNEEQYKWEQFPLRGSKEVLKMLLQEGSIEDSEEIREIVDAR